MPPDIIRRFLFYKEDKMKNKNLFALLPILVFLILFVGIGIATKDFYVMPTVVGFLIALLVAFLQNKNNSFEKKLSIVAKGAGDENIITMCLIFVLAGAFSGAVKAAGGVESTVNFGLSILPSSFIVVGIFIIGCFISVSMGTSVGTIAALSPIALGIAEKTGFSVPLCIGAVVCGAMFGDNLSMISDTTIAAVRTQGCEMKDKFKQNFFIVLPAAIITILIFIFKASNADIDVTEVTGNLSYNFIQIIPYLVVLIGALAGLNVFVVLISGTLISVIIGLALGCFKFVEVFVVIGDGIAGMYEITIISLIVAGVVALVKENGGIEYIIQFIKSKISGRKGAELGIALLASVVDICTVNNTVAIVMAGPIAKEISNEFDVDAKTSASILDIFTSVWQGIIPYGAQLLTAASLAGITPIDIMPNLFYPILMGVSALIFILFIKKRK